jgi:hypothetical protein
MRGRLTERPVASKPAGGGPTGTGSDATGPIGPAR